MFPNVPMYHASYFPKIPSGIWPSLHLSHCQIGYGFFGFIRKKMIELKVLLEGQSVSIWLVSVFKFKINFFFTRDCYLYQYWLVFENFLQYCICQLLLSNSLLSKIYWDKTTLFGFQFCRLAGQFLWSVQAGLTSAQFSSVPASSQSWMVVGPLAHRVAGP